MRPRAVLKLHSNSYPFDERTIDLTGAVKVGRAVAKSKPQGDNAIFDCKVLSRNHAVIWYENGKFFIKDTCSSNGTFINNNRLSPANENSPGKEIHSNDIIQFGVEVLDSTSKITHGCIILRIKLFYPGGGEVSRTASMLNIPTANMLPPYYSYTQMMEREKLIYQKLNSIEDILEEAHLLADMSLVARDEATQLKVKNEELQNICDEQTKFTQKLESELQALRDKLDEEESSHQLDRELIKTLQTKSRRRDFELETSRKQVDRVTWQNHWLLTTSTLLLLIVLVVGGFDMIVMFIRLIYYYKS